MPLKFIFRQIHGPRPETWMAGLHWYVEAHDVAHDMAYPVGICFVSAHADMKLTMGHEAMVDYLLVDDRYRRRGVATALIAAITERWPTIDLGEAVTVAGEALLSSQRRAGQNSAT